MDSFGKKNKKKGKVKVGFIIPFVLIVACFMAFTPTGAMAATFDVDAGGNTGLEFLPSPVTIAPGDRVRWTFGSGSPHTVTSGSSAGGTCQDTFDSGNKNAGTTFLHTFNTAGTCNYRCQVHFGFMDGVVEVTAPAPAAPENLNAVVRGWGNMTDWTTIDLSWDDTSLEDGYRIERCVGSGCSGFSTLTTVGANVTNYADSGLSENVTYNYRVIAFNSAGDSPPSNESEAKTGPDTGPPTQPGNVQATAHPSLCNISVTWDPSTDDIGVAGYNVYRDSDPTPIATTTNTTFEDSGLAQGATHTYEVEAFDPAGNNSTRGASGPATTSASCGFGGGGGGGQAILHWSTRAQVSTGSNITISAFIIDGTDPKTVLVTARGPSLTGVSSPTLADPFLAVYQGGTIITQNDNWQTTDPLCDSPAISCGDATDIQNTGLDPCSVGTTGCTQESAVLVTLPPGTYNARMSGVSGGTGIGLIDIYDMDSTPVSILSNVSTRGLVQTGDRIMIGVLDVVGPAPATVMIRGRGPSLGSPPFNFSGVLADPRLQVFSGSTVIAQNDDWQTTDPLCGSPAIYCNGPTEMTSLSLDPCQPNPGQSTPPPNCEKEAAILMTVPPGSYPIFLTGVGGTTGLGLVDIFHIPTKKLANISTRAFVGTGNSVTIGGFIIEGSSPKTVLIRGRGPSLSGAPFNLSGTLANPFLKIYSFGEAAFIAQNDDWQTDDPLCGTSGYVCGGEAEIIATGLDPCQPNPGQTTAPPGCTNESAVLITLPPGQYGAIMSGVSSTTGIGLVEAFDTDGNEFTILTNISTRAFVGTGNRVTIGGFIIEGGSPKTVLVRGRGPSLSGAPFNLSGTLADPFLRIYSFADAAFVAQNDNWQTDDPLCGTSGFTCGSSADIIATGLDPCQPNPGQSTAPPGCTNESAVLITLPPGQYGAIMEGVSSTTGIGLVETFEID